MSRSISLLIVLLIKIAILGFQLTTAEGNDQNEHSQPSLVPLRSGNRPLSGRLTSAMKGEGLVDRDEDHANVDLDKINESHRYRLTADSEGIGQKPMDTNAIDRLLGRILSRGETSRFVKNQLRHDYHGSDMPKDDSLVGDLSNKNVFEQQRIANLISSVLRDMILADGERFYRTSRSNRQPPIRSFGAIFERGPAVDYYNAAEKSFSNQDSVNSNINEAGNVIYKHANREKRRRCKVDPNLGVKNPSFCDTDAYFGAADYSMRDVWDSAGR